MNDEPIKDIVFDPRLTSYESFFDYEWAKRITDVASNANKLDRLVLDLTAAFKGISWTFSLPSLAVWITEGYWSGHAKVKRLPDAMVMQLISHIAARIEHEVVLSPTAKTEVKRAMVSLAEEFFHIAESQPPIEFDRDSLWEGIVGPEMNPEMDSAKTSYRLALWACPRVCFSALFFAYEDFILRSVNLKSHGVVSQVDQKFSKACVDNLGTKVGNHCWTDPKIQTAKMIRHSLVHVGGRETPKLKKMSHGIRVENEELQIMPEDVKKLFDVLMDRSLQITEWAAGEPEFL